MLQHFVAFCNSNTLQQNATPCNNMFKHLIGRLKIPSNKKGDLNYGSPLYYLVSLLIMPLYTF